MHKAKPTNQPASSARKQPSVWLLLGALVLLFSVYVAQQLLFETQVVASRTDIPPQFSPQGIDIFFTSPWLVYPDIQSQRQPPPHEQALIADIDAARSHIDIAAFEYNLLSIAHALLRAQQRGVRIRLALDHENLHKPEQARWAGLMQQANIPIAWEGASAFMHSKFAVIDSQVVWMGSWNFTSNGTYRNSNNLLRITIPEIVHNYATEFEQMIAGSFGNQKAAISPYPVIERPGIRIENYFSPQDRAEQYVVARVQQAQSSIYFMAFSYTSDAVGLAMIERHAAGVTVQGIFETRNARGIGSEFQTLKEAGVDVLEDGNCYTFHHKVIILDQQTVITGSFNFTDRANDTNDENLLIIDNPAIAQHYLEEFERVYQHAQQPTRCSR